MKIRSYVVNLFARESSFFFAVPALVWQVLFFYVPLLVVLGLSITKKGDLSAWRGLTFEHYTLFFQWTYGAIIARSFFIALGTMLLCLLGGYPVAYYMACRARGWRNVLLFMIIVPFWTNFVVQVYAWFFVLEKHGLLNSVALRLGLIQQPIGILNSLFAVYLVMLYCYLPFMIMPIYSSLEKFDLRLLEASADLGASAWRTWYRVTLPLSAPGIKTGCLLVFVLSFGEFLIPELMGGGKLLYMGSLIAHYFLIARSMHEGAALTGISCLFLLSCTALIHFFFKYCVVRTPQGE